MNDVSIRTTDDGLETVGLGQHGQKELHVWLSSDARVDEAASFLLFIAQYVIDYGHKIVADETVEFGYWLVQFRESGPDALEAWEKTADASSFQRGLGLTLAYWLDQTTVCSRFGADFSPVRADKLAAVTQGVFDGLSPLEGVRYESEGEMSGWYVTAADYGGSISDLQIQHLYHVTSHRPDIARYLALPTGWHFRINGAVDVWADEESSP